MPRALRLAKGQGLIDVDPDDAYYFLSRITLQRGHDNGMPAWRKRLFLVLAHNAASPIEYFRLPQERTVAMGATVML